MPSRSSSLRSALGLVSVPVLFPLSFFYDFLWVTPVSGVDSKEIIPYQVWFDSFSESWKNLEKSSSLYLCAMELCKCFTHVRKMSAVTVWNIIHEHTNNQMRNLEVRQNSMKYLSLMKVTNCFLQYSFPLKEKLQWSWRVIWQYFSFMGKNIPTTFSCLQLRPDNLLFSLCLSPVFLQH